MAISATISKVSLANTANGPRIVLALSNGDAQWYPQSYISKLLAANFMEDARPTVLVGTEVSYNKVTYKPGDFSVDSAGKPTSVKHTKSGSKLVNFEFGDIAGHTTKYDEAMMKAKAVAEAASFIAKYTAKSAAEEVVVGTDGEDAI